MAHTPKSKTYDWGGISLIVEELLLATKPGQRGASSTITLSATELTWLDGVTAGTAEASKAMVTDSSNNIAGLNSMKIRGPVGTGATGAGLMVLQTAELTVVAADHLGRIEFQAPLETGAYALLVTAAFSARAAATFDATTNTTEFVWSLSAGDAVVDTLRLTATALQPETNDLIALGTTALGFSDVHIATGGVINWANGEVTITQTANDIALAGGTLSLAGNQLLGAGKETVADAATLGLTDAQSGATIVIDIASAVAITLPTAVAGTWYDFNIVTTNTTGDHKITAAASDDFVGALPYFSTGTAAYGVAKCDVTGYLRHVTKLVSKTGGRVNTHVRKATAKPLW